LDTLADLFEERSLTFSFDGFFTVGFASTRSTASQQSDGSEPNNSVALSFFFMFSGQVTSTHRFGTSLQHMNSSNPSLVLADALGIHPLGHAKLRQNLTSSQQAY
jgi:hypothetical protein